MFGRFTSLSRVIAPAAKSATPFGRANFAEYKSGLAYLSYLSATSPRANAASPSRQRAVGMCLSAFLRARGYFASIGTAINDARSRRAHILSNSTSPPAALSFLTFACLFSCLQMLRAARQRRALGPAAPRSPFPSPGAPRPLAAHAARHERLRCRGIFWNHKKAPVPGRRNRLTFLPHYGIITSSNRALLYGG